MAVPELEYDLNLINNEIEWLLKNKIIKVANDPTNTPLEYIDENGLTQIIAVGDTPYRGSNKMAARKDFPHLASALLKAMQSITAAERTEISRKWLGLAIVNELLNLMDGNLILESARHDNSYNHLAPVIARKGIN